jgi:hypothetical protein
VQALPERTHPQWSWLQCRYSSVMSYRLAQVFLRDAFPGGRSLASSSVKANASSAGTRRADVSANLSEQLPPPEIAPEFGHSQ